MQRRFSYWCEKCPTRIEVVTDNPEYIIGDGTGAYGCESNFVIADLCPACGGQLHELDTLQAHEDVPRTFEPDQEKTIHDAWRATMKEHN